MRTSVEELQRPSAARRVVAVLESEADGGELAGAFAERGARVVRVGATSEAFYYQLEEVRGLLDELAAGRYELVVFMTGGAVSSLI